MNRVTHTCLAAAVLVAVPLHPAAAQSARLRHVLSVYADDKGVGLNLPEGVACGANGQLVVADTVNDRLLRFTYQDKAITLGTEIKVAQLSAPVRVHLNSKGEIYALDNVNRRIVRLGPDGAFKGALTYEAIQPSTVVPKAFAIDTADNLYVLDTFGARVLVLSAEGTLDRTLPLPKEAGFATDLAVDFAGTVLLVDSLARRLFSATKEATSFSPLGGDLTEYLATLPTSITASKGVIFVAEGIGGRVVSFGRDGSFLSRQLTMGWEDGALNYPSQLCISDKDEVFVADRDNSRVQVFQLIR